MHVFTVQLINGDDVTREERIEHDSHEFARLDAIRLMANFVVVAEHEGTDWTQSRVLSEDCELVMALTNDE